MAVIIPQFDMKTAAGGFMSKFFNNLPRPFTPNPKAQSILSFVPNGAPLYAYISIENSTLYLHSRPLRTAAFTPEASFSLGDYSVASLAAALTSGGYGYTVSTMGAQDGTTAVLLLGFVNQPLNGADTVQIQLASSRLWKTLYPIAQALYGAEQSAADAENALDIPFARGFWLDFWGDWLNTPRLPGMSDLDYVVYILWGLRAPKVNNIAMEDILTNQYGVPVKVVDAGVKQFSVQMDAGVMGTVTAAMIAPVVNQIKAAGVSWLMNYYTYLSENYKTYYAGRSNGQSFQNSDKLGGQTLSPQEAKFGYMGSEGFKFNSSPLNSTPLTNGYKLQDSYYFTLLLNPFSERKMYSTEAYRWFKFNSSAFNNAPLGVGGRSLIDDDIKLSLGFSEQKGRPVEVIGAAITQIETRYGYMRAGGFAFNSGKFNSTPTGSGYGVKDAVSLSLALSETGNFRKNGTPAFGTSGGILLAPLNQSGFRNFLQEGVQMYYNNPADPSSTRM